MAKFNQRLETNNIDLQNILDTINALPEAGGIELPALDNEGAAADILSGKQFINQEGEIVEGTMPNNGAISQTMDGINTKSVTIPSGYTQGGSVSLDNTISNEVTTQTNLIAQITAAVDGLPEAGGGGTIETCTVLIDKSNFSISDAVGYATYHTYENNTIYCTAVTQIIHIPETITNFISGSVITIYLPSTQYTFLPQNNCEVMMRQNGFIAIKVTATAGETASIYVQYNDF